MKTFYHGGRIGDLIFALWTMRELGGGRLVVSDFHHPNWSLGTAVSMDRLLRHQPYVQEVLYTAYRKGLEQQVDYDLHAAEDDHNPQAIPGYDTKSGWPGNANIAARYGVHFGLQYRPADKWLTAPASRLGQVDVVVHCPVRRMVRDQVDWLLMVGRLRDSGLHLVIVGPEDQRMWAPGVPEARVVDGDLLDSADWINSAKVFLGTVSSCNAIAEGLKKRRFVEQAPDCFNVNVSPETGGTCINGMDKKEVVDAVIQAVREQG